jgi:DNA-binding transcriptional MerR regulator
VTRFDAFVERVVAALPFLRDFLKRVADFAAESSWKRIGLIGLVVLIACNVVGVILSTDKTEVVSRGMNKPLNIEIHDDKDSVVITPMVNGKPGKTVKVPIPPEVMEAIPDRDTGKGAARNSDKDADKNAGKGSDKNSDSDSDNDSEGDKGSDHGKTSVGVDKDALSFERNGKRFVIDSHGVHVQTSDGPALGPLPPLPAQPAKPAAAAPPAPSAPASRPESQAAKSEALDQEQKAEIEREIQQAREEHRQEFNDAIKDAIDESRDDINQAIADTVAANSEKVTVHRREGLALWDFMQVLIVISFAYVVAMKIASTKTQRADAMVRSASMTADRESLQRQLVEARLQMMQAQVEPHFLFNTLASVDYLIETDPSRASTMQKNLIQYLRAALPQMRETATYLGREVDLVRAYLEILKVRMEERLQVAFNVPDGLRSADFPPMMLQSLVENAIKHGLEPKSEGGSVTVSAEVIDGDLFVSVADTGLGFSPGGAGTSGGGVGLTNIRERLGLLYAGRARFLVEANQPSGTRVSIVIPYQSLGKRNPEKEGGPSS